MSEYQRFVSYIYLYDKGIKVKNSGFAKIECKDNVLRIKMNLKGVFNNSFEKWTVYLLTEGEKELLGLYLGELKGKGSSAEFQMICSSENLNKTSKSFQDVKGLAIVSSGNKKYATFWINSDITIESFREYSELEEQKSKHIFNFKKEKKEEAKYLEAMSVIEEAEKKKEKVSVEPSIQEKKPEKVLTKEVVDEKGQIKNSLYEREIEMEEAQRMPEPEPDPEPEPEPEGNLNENWDKLIREYKSMNPFSDNEIECIRIELKDLRLLPKSQWVLSSNSFVLHGFYNYQYLILGKVKERFIIGVPGIFCNKEKLVAGLFGFNDFKPAQVAEYKTGRFGYWYKYL